MYAAIGTCPDISFTVQHLSQFMSNPEPAYWTAVKCVLCYLNGTHDLGIIHNKRGEVEPLAFSDADWGSDVNDWKSILGYIFQMSNGLMDGLCAGDMNLPGHAHALPRITWDCTCVAVHTYVL